MRKIQFQKKSIQNLLNLIFKEKVFYTTMQSRSKRKKNFSEIFFWSSELSNTFKYFPAFLIQFMDSFLMYESSGLTHIRIVPVHGGEPVVHTRTAKMRFTWWAICSLLLNCQMITFDAIPINQLNKRRAFSLQRDRNRMGFVVQWRM